MELWKKVAIDIWHTYESSEIYYINNTKNPNKIVLCLWGIIYVIKL